MRRLWATATVAVAVCAMVLLTSGGAAAKGPSQAVIEGPGLTSPITVGDPGPTSVGAQQLGDLIQRSGLFTQLWCTRCGGRLRERPSGELGPRYVVTYTMGDPTDAAASTEVTQDLYPFASPQPVTFMSRGQPFWGTQRTVGGWFVGHPGLRHLLREIGLPAPATAATVQPVPTDGGRTLDVPHETGRSILVPTLAILLALTMLVALAFIRWGQRRRASTPATPQT